MNLFRNFKSNRRCAIVCVNEQGAIGKDGELLYRIKEDMKWFKAITEGQIVVMGYRTFKELGQPLPNRLNIVVYDKSRGKPSVPEEVILLESLSEVMIHTSFEEERDIIFIGGESLYLELYSEFRDRLDFIYRTKVFDEAEGDRFFIDDETLQTTFTCINKTGIKKRTGLNRVTNKHNDYQFEVWKHQSLVERADMILQVSLK